MSNDISVSEILQLGDSPKMYNLICTMTEKFVGNHVTLVKTPDITSSEDNPRELLAILSSPINFHISCPKVFSLSSISASKLS